MSRTLKLWEKMVAVFASVALAVSLCPTVTMAAETDAAKQAWNEEETVLTIDAAKVFTTDADGNAAVSDSMDDCLRYRLGISKDAESVSYAFANMTGGVVGVDDLKAGVAYEVVATYDDGETAEAVFVLNAYEVAQSETSPDQEDDGKVWVQGDVAGSVDELTCGNSYEHTHGDSCYYKSCNHKEGHLSDCYSNATSYALCEHSNDSEHTGSVTVADVVSVSYKYGVIPTGINWVTTHPAYNVVYAKYIELSGGSSSLTEQAKAVVKLLSMKFCYTVSASAEPDLCTHTCSEVGGGCYTKICVLSEHAHSDACYTTIYTYDWFGYVDANDNGVADYTETVSITWKNEDGTNLSTDEVAYGETPAYAGPMPTKNATAQYTYTFEGWTPAITPAVIVTSDGANAANAYTATYAATTNTYTVTWVNEDGSILETDTGVEYGSRPFYDGATPTKEAGNNEDGIYCEYTFSGWSGSPETSTVTGDVTYWATYSTEKCYQVAFETGDGSAVETKYVAENGTATKPVDDPTREGYRFGGWYTDEACTDGNEYDFATQVTADVTLYAKWVEQVTLTFSYDSSAIVFTGEPAVTVDNGIVVADPGATAADGYTFYGWYADEACTEVYKFETPVTQDTVVYAKWVDNDCFVNVTGDVTYSVNDGASVAGGTTTTIENGETEVTVVLTPAAGKYIVEATLDGDAIENYANGLVTVAFETGVATTYTIEVETESIFILTGSTAVNYYSGITAADLKANIFNTLVNVPDGITLADVVIEFQNLTWNPLPTYEWVELTDGTIGEFAESGAYLGEKVRISYAGDGVKYPAASTDETTVSLSDLRGETSVDLKAVELSMPTSDTSFTEAQVLSEMGFKLNGVAYTDYAAVDGLTVTIVKDGTDADLSVVSEDGTYTVTVSYAANNEYKGSEGTATLKVTDGRDETSIAIEDATVAYDVHKNWTDETWYANVVDVMNIELAGADADVTLSQTEYPGAGTYTITASYAGDNTHQPAADASATLTLVAAPTASTVKLDEAGCEGAVVVVNGTTIGGDVQTVSVDNGAEVVITVSPAEGYYLTGASVNDVAATDNGDGTFAYSFEAPYAGTEFIVKVDAVEKSAPVFSLADDSTDVASLNFSIDENEIKAKVFKSVTVNGGTITDANKVTIASIDGVAGQTAITTVGDHKVVIAYAGDDKTAAGSAETTLTVVDKRPATTVVTKSDPRIGYVGQTITAEQIAAELVSSVTSNGETVEGGTELVVLDGYVSKWVGGESIGAYIPTASQTIGGNTLADLLDATGKYRASVKFVGNDDYAASESVVVEFEVYDNRTATILNAKNESVEATDLSKINYTASDVEKLVFKSVTEADTETVVEGAEVDVVLITKGASVVYSAGVDGYAAVDGSITEVGEYTVVLQFEDTVTHKSSTASVKFTVKDARSATQVNLLDGKVFDCTAPGSITDEMILSQVFAGVSLQGDPEAVIASEISSVTLAVYSISSEGETKIAAADIVEAGTYKAVVSFAETNQYLGSQASIDFSVSDGRNVTAVVANENVSMGLNPLTGEILTAESIISALNLVVMDVDANETIAADAYTVSFDVDPAEMEIGGTYVITVSFAGNLTQAPCSRVIEFDVVDGRAAVQLDVNESVEVAYGATSDELLAAMLEGRTGLVDAETGDAVEGELTLSADISTFNVGTYTITVSFAGDDAYQAIDAEVETVVVKADTSVAVDSQVVTYTSEGYNTKNFVSTSPEAEHMTFAVGLVLGDDASADAGVDAYINIPNLIDLDSVPSIVRPYIESALGALTDGATMSVSELKAALTNLSEGIEAANGVLDGISFIDFSIDTQAIDTLIGILTQIEKLEGVGDLTVYVTTDNDGVAIKNAGVYLTGAVTTDSNYNTASGIGYLVITPDATKVELAFNIEDENGFVTYHALRDGSYDLDSHVVQGDLTDEQLAEATAQLANLFVGVDMNGEPVIVDSQDSLALGAYTQIAYIADLGNEMFYAEPIVRAFAVVTDWATLEFVGGESQQFVFTGEPQGMTATAADRAGNPLPSEYISYKYLGVEGDIEVYNSSEAPTHAGAYTVIATYLDLELNHAGIAVGTQLITPAEASVGVSDLYHTYDGAQVDVASMVSSTPADAKVALITAGLDVSGDFSENGLSAVSGVVNVDFPARVDELLKTVVPSAYADGITVDSFVGKLAEAKDKLIEIGIPAESVDELIATLESMPNATTLTFKEQADVSPTAIGAYLVVACTMDPDYQLAADLGVLVIAPEVTKATLQWDYEDTNGIFTTTLLQESPELLNATPYDADANKVDAKVAYLYVGINEEGAYVSTADPSKLDVGVYTQIAFIGEEISASMVVAEPIMRNIIVAPQMVDVDFVDAVGENNERLFTYDGSPKSMDVKVTDLAGNEVTGDRLENLTVIYVGFDSELNFYKSAEAPTAVGSYKVYANYLERDAAGNAAYIGGAVGLMVIERADADYALSDVTVAHDGTEKWVQVVNGGGFAYEVSAVIDEGGNVNVIAPEGWNVEARSIENVDELIDALAADVEDMASVAQDEAFKAALDKFAAALRNADIKSIEINGEKPSEVGVYKIHSVAFGSATHKPAYDAAALTITHDEVVDEAVPATCTETGLTAGSHCEVCGEVILAQEEVPAKGHGETELVGAKEATTTEDGYTGDKVCMVCGETVEYGEVIPADAAVAIDEASIAVSDVVYSGENQEPSVIVKLNGEVLAAENYTVSYENNINVGSAQVTVTAVKAPYTGVAKTTFEITPASIADAVISPLSDMVYTGEEIVPEITIMMGDKVLEEGRDYQITWINNVGVGTAEATIVGIGNYKDETSASFKIVKANVSVQRLWGQNAYGTMKAISNEGFADGSCNTVVLATFDGYWDALTASSLAGLYSCPVLLTGSSELDATAASEIKRLGADKVYIIGGPVAISEGVESQVRALGVTTERLAGENAMGTARAVYKEGKGQWGSTAIVATSDGYWDALSASPYAYAKAAPIFLTHPESDKLASADTSAIKSGGFDRLVICGGTDVVSSAVDKSFSGIDVVRLGGANAYDTSVLIVNWCLTHGMSSSVMGVATGTGYWDALTGASLCGMNNAPILLVADGYTQTIDKVLAPNRSKVLKVYVFGGEAAVSKSVYSEILSAVKG